MVYRVENYCMTVSELKEPKKIKRIFGFSRNINITVDGTIRARMTRIDSNKEAYHTMSLTDFRKNPGGAVQNAVENGSLVLMFRTSPRYLLSGVNDYRPELLRKLQNYFRELQSL